MLLLLLELEPFLMQSLESGSVAFIMITMWYCPLLGILRALTRARRNVQHLRRRQHSAAQRSVGLGIFYYYHRRRRRRRRSPCFTCPKSAFLGRTHTHTNITDTHSHTKSMRSASLCQLLLLVLSAAYLQPTSTTSSVCSLPVSRSPYMSFCCVTAKTIHARLPYPLTLTLFSLSAVLHSPPRIWYHRIPISV